MANLTRYFMYQQIKRKLKKPLKGKILGVSGIENFLFLINQKKSQLTKTSYPSVNMERLPFKSGSFNVVISDQVIEHLANPQKAINESYRVLKKGGLAIHTSCLLNPIHPPGKDYWRFTTEGLRSLCWKFSKIIECDGWGNRLAIFLILLKDSFRFTKVSDSKANPINWLATFNEKKYPIVTWVIAQK